MDGVRGVLPSYDHRREIGINRSDKQWRDVFERVEAVVADDNDGGDEQDLDDGWKQDVGGVKAWGMSSG